MAQHRDGTDMGGLTIGVLGRSRKADERRLALHPAHLDRIDPDLRARILLEEGYGERFGSADSALAPLVGGMRTRAALIAECDVIVLPKPLAADLAELREGQVLWGWPHCVQDEQLTQLAIDRRLTLIAWEAMNHWGSDGSYQVHVFHKNNELAGYCAVLHAMEQLGITGAYGRRLRAAVISFGATARGAVTALNALGVIDVDVLTHRDVSAVASPLQGAHLVHFDRDPADPSRAVVIEETSHVPLAEFVAGHDIVVNCVLQDTDAPWMFVTSAELDGFAPGSLIVDVSCDEGMGFEWARPTSFAAPIADVGAGVHYYAVDHSPSFLWNSSTWEVSEALLPYLPTVAAGPVAWDAEQTISRAIEIRDGVVQNAKILSFQNRDAEYPHRRR